MGKHELVGFSDGNTKMFNVDLKYYRNSEINSNESNDKRKKKFKKLKFQTQKLLEQFSTSPIQNAQTWKIKCNSKHINFLSIIIRFKITISQHIFVVYNRLIRYSVS